VSRAAAAAIAVVAAIAAARSKPAPESLPECSRETADVPRAVVIHLGGCSQPTRRVRGLVGGLGEAGPGWSLVLATDHAVRELRRRGCPTAVVCTSGNEFAALQQFLPSDELARRLESVKARARPPLRAGVDGGPVVPWD